MSCLKGFSEWHKRCSIFFPDHRGALSGPTARGKQKPIRRLPLISSPNLIRRRSYEEYIGLVAGNLRCPLCLVGAAFGTSRHPERLQVDRQLGKNRSRGRFDSNDRAPASTTIEGLPRKSKSRSDHP